MAIDERVTTLYLGRSLTDLSWEQKFYETLTNHGFELYPSDNPFWVKFDGFNENSVMYTIEGTDIDDFPTFYIRDKGGKEQVVRCSYKASIVPSDKGMSPELRQSAKDKLKDILSGLELEVVQEETK